MVGEERRFNWTLPFCQPASVLRALSKIKNKTLKKRKRKKYIIIIFSSGGVEGWQKEGEEKQATQSSGAVWKSRWSSWAASVPPLIVLMVSVDVKQHWTEGLSEPRSRVKVEVVVLGCSPAPNSPYGLCRRKATLNWRTVRAQEPCETRGGRPGLTVPNSPYQWSLWTHRVNILRA